jgi:hypothetical protein
MASARFFTAITRTALIYRPVRLAALSTRKQSHLTICSIFFAASQSDPVQARLLTARTGTRCRRSHPADAIGKDTEPYQLVSG